MSDEQPELWSDRGALAVGQLSNFWKFLPQAPLYLNITQLQGLLLPRPRTGSAF